MPSNINGISGVNPERSPASADVLAEARQRQTERLRAAQAANAKPTEVVEKAAKSEPSPTPASDSRQSRYRVTFDKTSGRMSTELVDAETGDVIVRIPPKYVSPEDALKPQKLDEDTNEVEL
jgi:uncharacterized FlaG/YvyC family protein